MNEEQLKKDRELLSSWKEKLIYDAPGSCSFCMSEDEGADEIVTLEDCEALLEAQARVVEAEIKSRNPELFVPAAFRGNIEDVASVLKYMEMSTVPSFEDSINACLRVCICNSCDDQLPRLEGLIDKYNLQVFINEKKIYTTKPNPEQDGK